MENANFLESVFNNRVFVVFVRGANPRAEIVQLVHGKLSEKLSPELGWDLPQLQGLIWHANKLVKGFEVADSVGDISLTGRLFHVISCWVRKEPTRTVQYAWNLERVKSLLARESFLCWHCFVRFSKAIVPCTFPQKVAL